MATMTSTQMANRTDWQSTLRNLNITRIVLWILIGILIFITFFPFYWVVRTALTGPQSIYTNVGSILPVDPTTDNFARVLGLLDAKKLVEQGASNITVGTLNFWTFVRNSFIVAGAVGIGQTLFSSMAAYAFARFNFPGRDKIFFIYLTGLMIPGIVLFLPNYVFVRQLGWIGTFQGVIAPTFLMSPFAVFFMRQFFLSLNKELEEAALLDGASAFGVFWRIALPLMTGPLLTLGLLTFISAWNDYLWPFLVGRDESVRVLTVALSVFRSQTPQGSPDWTGLMAGAAVALVPTLLLFIFFGRRVVDSVQFSGFK